MREMLRPAVFIPESKRLNVLLKDFRRNRNHMAIVVDEYGGVAGLVTIEDVLEQIVGDIEDEYDFDETEANILLDRNGLYRVKAQTEIEDFNATFGTEFSDEEYDTIGGLVLSTLRAPAQARRGDRDRRPALPRAARRQPAACTPCWSRSSGRRMSARPGRAPRRRSTAGLAGAVVLCGARQRFGAGLRALLFLAGSDRTLAALAWLIDQAASPRRAAVLGFAFGLGYFLTGTSWVYVSMHEFGGMTVPLAASPRCSSAPYLALFPAAAAWMSRRMPARARACG